MCATFSVTTFGVELECTITRHYMYKFLHLCKERGVEVKNYYSFHSTKGINEWLLAYDGSINPEPSRRGIELKSPILHLDSSKDYTDLATVVTTLAECKATVNRSCGFHVHFGGFSQPLDVTTLLKMRSTYYNDEEYFDSLVLSSRRGDFCPFSKSPHPENSYTDRHQKLNVACYEKFKTVEFRHHQGTLNLVEIFNWVRLCHAFLERGFKTNWNSPTNDFYCWLDSLNAESDEVFKVFFTERRDVLNSTYSKD